MEKASQKRSTNQILEEHLTRVGSKAALGAPDDESAQLWSDTAISDEIYKIEQAATDYAAIQKAITDLGTRSLRNMN